MATVQYDLGGTYRRLVYPSLYLGIFQGWEKAFLYIYEAKDHTINKS